MSYTIEQIEQKFLEKLSDENFYDSKPGERLPVYRNTLNYLANEVINKPQNRDLITKSFIDNVLRVELSNMIVKLRDAAVILVLDFDTIIQNFYEVIPELEVISTLKAERVGIRDKGTITREIAIAFNTVEQKLNKIVAYIDTEIEDLKQ